MRFHSSAGAMPHPIPPTPNPETKRCPPDFACTSAIPSINSILEYLVPLLFPILSCVCAIFCLLFGGVLVTVQPSETHSPTKMWKENMRSHCLPCQLADPVQTSRAPKSSLASRLWTGVDYLSQTSPVRRQDWPGQIVEVTV